MEKARSKMILLLLFRKVVIKKCLRSFCTGYLLSILMPLLQPMLTVWKQWHGKEDQEKLKMVEMSEGFFQTGSERLRKNKVDLCVLIRKDL